MFIVSYVFSNIESTIQPPDSLDNNHYILAYPMSAYKGTDYYISYEYRFVDYVSINANGGRTRDAFSEGHYGKGGKLGLRYYPLGKNVKLGSKIYPIRDVGIFIGLDVGYYQLNSNDKTDYLWNNQKLTDYTSLGFVSGLNIVVFKHLLFSIDIGYYSPINQTTITPQKELQTDNWIGDPIWFLPYSSIDINLGVGVCF